MTAPLTVLVLAAGQGTRMRSQKPKVLHELAGRPLVGHVLDTANKLDATKKVLIHGHGSEALIDYTKQKYSGLILVKQDKQLGTGHAVQQALPFIEKEEKVLILYGDVPLIGTDTLSSLIKRTKDVGILTAKAKNPTGYGRILRADDGRVLKIVEQKDATPDVLDIKEINTGILCVSGQHLHALLPGLTNDNKQKEYYLTDLIGMAVESGLDVQTHEPSAFWEVEGVNNPKQLADLERVFQAEQAQRYQESGLYLKDANRFDVRGTLTFGRDVSIDVGVVFEGEVTLGDHVKIGPYCVIKNAVVGTNTEIKSHSSIEGANIGSDCDVGPYARIRPGTELASSAKIGNFVETKKSKIGQGSKVNHLSYIGDSDIAEDVNIGAGTITCNYDGVNKHKTVIESGVFIGSNSSLVAPVTVEKNATVGAGSTITKGVPEATLGVARGRQVHITSWKRPEKLK